jgi:hypothetical protein
VESRGSHQTDSGRFLDTSISRASNLLKTHENELHTVSHLIKSLDPLHFGSHLGAIRCHELMNAIEVYMYRSSADDGQLAKALVEYETLSLDEVKKVLGGQKLERLEALKALGDEVLLGEEERKGQGEIVEGI